MKNTNQAQFKLPIIVAEDLSLADASARKRTLAVHLTAKWLSDLLHADVQLVHVENTSLLPVDRPLYQAGIRQFVATQLEGLKSIAFKYANHAKTLILPGDPTETLIRLAKQKTKFSHLVMGTHGRKGLARFFLGSTAEEVIRHATIPVVSVGPVAQLALSSKVISQRVFFLCSDLGSNSHAATEYAIALSKTLKFKLIIAHSLFEDIHPVMKAALASPTTAAELTSHFEEVRIEAAKRIEVLAKRLKKLKIEHRIEISDENRSGHESLLALIKTHKPAAVIAGTHGRNLALNAFLGSTARHLIHHSPCPVITVRSK